MEWSQIVEALQVRTSIRHNGLCYYKTLKSKRHAEARPREHLKTDIDGPKANHCDSHVNCAPNSSSGWTPLVPKWWHCWERLQNLQEVDPRWRRWVTKGRTLRFYSLLPLPVHSSLPDCRCHQNFCCYLFPTMIAFTVDIWARINPSPLSCLVLSVSSQLWEKELWYTKGRQELTKAGGSRKALLWRLWTKHDSVHTVIFNVQLPELEKTNFCYFKPLDQQAVCSDIPYKANMMCSLRMS